MHACNHAESAAQARSREAIGKRLTFKPATMSQLIIKRAKAKNVLAKKPHGDNEEARLCHGIIRNYLEHLPC